MTAPEQPKTASGMAWVMAPTGRDMRTVTRPAVVLAAVSVLLALAGCGGPSGAVGPPPTAASASPSPAAVTDPAPIPSATADMTTFHTVWGMIEPGATPDIEDQLAAAICGGFATGVDMSTQMMTIEAARSVNKITAGLMIHAAVEYTCPEYVAQMVPVP